MLFSPAPAVRKILLAVLLTAALPFRVFAAAEVSGHPGNATVFIYHHFGDDRYPSTNVAVERFSEQMAYLSENGYHVISLAELVSILREKKKLPPRTVTITIDDGYRTIYTKAWPILKKYRYPFTVFLYVEGVEKGYKNYLTWEQITEMRDAGVDFQDHSYSHQRLADWPKGLTESEYRQWLRADLSKGMMLLQEKIGERPRFFALPYGEYNRIVIEEARAVGYDAILTQDAGSIDEQTDLYLMPREPILGSEWSTLKHFKEVLERRNLPVAERMPDIEPLRRVPEKFGARLLTPERYEPESFGIYISELGWRRAKIDGDVVSVENTASLTRRMNRVMISAREKGSGRTAVSFWMLVKPVE